MFEQLRNRASRRLFVVIASLFGLGGALIHLGSTWFLARPNNESISPLSRTVLEFTSQVGGAIFTGALTAGFLLLMFHYLFKDEEVLRQIEVLDPEREHRLHEEALEKTEIWFHNGHIARWVRTRALPALAQGAKEGTHCEARLLLLNPNDRDVCERYSRYRHRLLQHEQGFSTLADTVAEVLATITAAVAYANETGLSTSVAFKSSFDATRLDFASTVAFRTLVNPLGPGVAYYKSNDPKRPGFYEALREGFENAFAEAIAFRPVKPETIRLGDLTETKLTKFLGENGFPTDHSLVRSVLSRVRSDYSPFT